MIDPVTIAVVRGALEECVREMDELVVASAFSPIISEGRDCAHAVFEANSDLVVQGEFSLPLFIASLQAVARHVVATTELEPGDVALYNHPDTGGTHVQDVKLIAPVHIGGELTFLLGSTGHWLDIGGAIPGGWHPESTSVFAEGLVLNGAKLVRGGTISEDVLGILLANARAPVALEGDIRAQLSALELGRTRLLEIVDRHGLAAVLEVVAELKARSERQIRDRIRSLDGHTARFEDFVDNDGIVDEPIRIVCELAVRGDDLYLDFSESSDQSRGPLNLPAPGTESGCHIAIKHWWPDIPINAGCFVPIHVTTRPRSVVSSRFPAPVAGYSEVMQRVIDTVLGCLNQIAPDDAVGSPFGTTSGISLSTETETGTALAAWYLDGGYGASASVDGLVGGTAVNSTARLAPIEVFEHRAPVRFLERAIRPDSGGAGTFRGGCGSVHELEFTAPTTVAFLGDRTRRGAPGACGGANGAPAEWSFQLGDETWTPPMGAKGVTDVQPRDRLRILTPGGGGWGPPDGRDHKRIEQDRRDGYVTEGGSDD